MTTHGARAVLDVTLADAMAGVRRTATDARVLVEEAEGALLARLLSETLRIFGESGRTTFPSQRVRRPGFSSSAIWWRSGLGVSACGSSRRERLSDGCRAT